MARRVRICRNCHAEYSTRAGRGLCRDCWNNADIRKKFPPLAPFGGSKATRYSKVMAVDPVPTDRLGDYIGE